MLLLCSGWWKIVAAVLCIPLECSSSWGKERESSACLVLLSEEASRRLLVFPWSAFAHMQIIKPTSGSEECSYHDGFRIVKSLFLEAPDYVEGCRYPSKIGFFVLLGRNEF